MRQAELYYTGTVVEILDKVLYEIKVDIPGIKTGVKAYPMRGEVDEPRVGDFVLLKCLDPVFQSYYLYQKIKENDFIGFRSNGKMVDITPDYVQVAIFDPSNESWNDFSENSDSDDQGRESGGYRPTVTDWIKLDKDGNLDVHLRSNSNIVIVGDSKISISGSNTEIVMDDQDRTYNSNLSITVQGDTDIKVLGKTTLQSPNIEIKGPGKLTCKGVVTPSETGGPFIAVPVAPMPGTPMISGDTIILT